MRLSQSKRQWRIHFSRRIVNSWFSTIFVVGLSINSFASQQDSTEFLYEFDMRYVGSMTSVDPNYRYVIEYLVEMLHKNKSWTVHVRGHVCCGPSEKISKKRAKKVYKILWKSGIDKSRLSYKGYSDSKPLAFPEKTEEDQALNRRVDFIIHK